MPKEGFEAPPFGGADVENGAAVEIGVAEVTCREGRASPLRSGDGVWERCMTRPGERGPCGAGGGRASDACVGAKFAPWMGIGGNGCGWPACGWSTAGMGMGGGRGEGDGDGEGLREDDDPRDLVASRW